MHRAGICFEKGKALLCRLSSKGKILQLQTVLKEDVKQLDSVLKNYFTAASLAAGETLIKKTETKALGKRALKKNLKLQKEVITILPKEKTVSTVQAVSASQKTVLIFQITKKAYLARILKQLQPHILISSYQALFSFARQYFTQHQDLMLVHLAAEETVCLHIKEGHLQAGYNINIGIKNISSKENQDIEKLPKEKKQLLDNLIKQINQTACNFCLKKTPLLLTGNLHLLKHLELFIFAKNKNLFSLQLTPKTREMSIYAVCIGAAWEANKKSFQQFCDSGFFPKKVIRKSRRMLAAVSALFLLLNGSLIWQGEKIRADKELQLQNNFAGIFAERPKNLPEMQHLLHIKGKRQKNPFINTAYKASDVLKWISSHPLLSQKKELQIFDFQYELVSFPKIGRWKDPYLAKVEIAFKTDNPVLARRIHLSLQKDSLILSKPELTWENSDTNYKAVFYLRSKNC